MFLGVGRGLVIQVYYRRKCSWGLGGGGGGGGFGGLGTRLYTTTSELHNRSTEP